MAWVPDFYYRTLRTGRCVWLTTRSISCTAATALPMPRTRSTQQSIASSLNSVTDCRGLGSIRTARKRLLRLKPCALPRAHTRVRKLRNRIFANREASDLGPPRHAMVESRSGRLQSDRPVPGLLRHCAARGQSRPAASAAVRHLQPGYDCACSRVQAQSNLAE